MKRELLSIENGKMTQNGNIVFDGLYLHVFKNEIAGVICDNIQTKRYLNKFLLGGLELNSGRLFIGGKRVSEKNAARIFARMVTLINKKSKLINNMSIAENIFLFSDSSFFIGNKKYDNRFRVLQKKLGIHPFAKQRPSQLTVRDRIVTELMRAYVEKKSLVILDDISGSLQKDELKSIFSVLFRLNALGMTFLLGIGFEDESLQKICRITAVKQCKTIAEFDLGKTDFTAFMRRVYFDEVTIRFGIKQKAHGFFPLNGQPLLEFCNVSSSFLKNISFSVDQGKLLKILCYDDLSCSHIIDLLKGILKPISGDIFYKGAPYCAKNISGDIFYKDAPYCAKNISSAIHQGICFIEECACDTMLFYNMNVVDNLGIPCNEKVHGFWALSKYSESIVNQMKRAVTNITAHTPIKRLKSNILLQIVYYKWLFFYPKIIVCINPFTDIDIYMRENVISMIHQYLRRGIAVLIVTSNYYVSGKFEGETIHILKGKQLDGSDSS